MGRVEGLGLCSGLEVPPEPPSNPNRLYSIAPFGSSALWFQAADTLNPKT